MAGKLSLALSLAIIALISARAQADIDKYVEAPATGELKIRQQCFVQFVIENTIAKYNGAKVSQELRRDLDETKKYVGQRYREGSSEAKICYSSAYTCSGIGAKKWPTLELISSNRFLDKVCRRWSKFATLCGLIKARSSGDRLRMTIESWVCQVSAESQLQLASDSAFGWTRKSCAPKSWQLGQQEGHEQLGKIEEFTLEDFEGAKRSLANEIANEKEMRAAASVKIVQEASKLISERIKNHFEEFSKCLAQKYKLHTSETLRREEEAKEEAAKEAAAVAKEEEEEKRKKKRGLIGKVFGQCFGGSCVKGDR